MATTDVKQSILKNFGKLPLTFIPNVGQTHSSVKHYAKSSGYGIYFTPDGVVFTFIEPSLHRNRNTPELQSPRKQPTQGYSIVLQFLGASPKTNPEARCEGTGKINYLKGNDPAKWITNLSTYEEVIYQELWAGVDLSFRGENGQLKYTFAVQPGVPIEDIRLTYRGADNLTLDEAGNLQIHTPYGLITDERPISYQEIDGQLVAVTSSYVLWQDEKGEPIFGFEVGNDYDPRYPLLIDPGIAYSTYLGGSGDDEGFGITVDALGNAYVTGSTTSTNFPVFPNPGAFQTTLAGGIDVFVTKLNPTGTALLYSTYLGGSGDDISRGIAVDAAGNAYVTGQTASTNFPVFPNPGAFQTTFGGGPADAFVTKLNPTGTALVYSTYLGGSQSDVGSGITIDALGNAYVAGGTSSTNFPVFPNPGAFQTTLNGPADAYVTKLNPAGSALVYSTFLGGSGLDDGFGIAVDALGNAYITGITESMDFPVFPNPGAVQTTFGGGISDVFVTKLNPMGAALVYSTYLGGSGEDVGDGITIDALGNAYLTGHTNSTNFPVFPNPGAFQSTFGGGPEDAIVTKLNTTGTALVYSTYLGGNGFDEAFGIGIDAAGNAFVTGLTGSTNFPVTNQSALSGVSDAFVTKLNPAGIALVDSTYLGGSGGDNGNGIVVDTLGNAYVIGTTNSTDFPVFPNPGAFQTTFGGVNDVFVTKLTPTITTTTSTTSTTTTTSSTSSTTTSTTTTTATTTSTTSTTTSTTQCPVANPQTCCVVAVEFLTQLVPPALEGSVEITNISVEAAIEAVCPENVVICGKVIKEITFTAVDLDGTLRPGTVRFDERPFQCVIDREDADEGNPSEFVIVGADILCEASASLQSMGTRPDIHHPGQTVNVFFKLREKDLVKVCIRRK